MKSNFRKLITIRVLMHFTALILVMFTGFTILLCLPSESFNIKATPGSISKSWKAPDVNLIPDNESGKLIAYGRELIKNTSKYLGPKGTVRVMSNGMNCQNCHLNAGTKYFGNNYSAVASTYPKYRSRSGSIETIEKRVNDCLQRSLNGSTLDSASREMRAIVAYMHWVGKDVKKGESPNGVGLVDLPFLNRAASPEIGKIVYQENCIACHGDDGQGLVTTIDSVRRNPPLWGEHSYNMGAGLFRLSRFAAFVKINMPLGATYDAPFLSDEEAWDVAAYVNTMPRPGFDLANDWPDISKKPFDHPFGPYKDSFSNTQHKYGPFSPVIETKKKLNNSK